MGVDFGGILTTKITRLINNPIAVLFIANKSKRACNEILIKRMHRYFNDSENSSAINNCLLLELNYVSLIQPLDMLNIVIIYYENIILMISRINNSEKWKGL